MAKQNELVVLNPFEAGVSYADFILSLGDKNIDKELSGICTTEQITWLKKELEIFNK